MSRLIDLTGQKFGRLAVIKRVQSPRPTDTMWDCICECGKHITTSSNHLRRGHSKSCGCLANELTSRRSKKHGMFGTRIYRIWFSMKQRCNNPGHIAYQRYGGRGIGVCDEWSKRFETFYQWAIHHGYADNLSIDRIDNNKGYSPDNCQWVNKIFQQNNRRSNVYITAFQKTLTVAQWARETGIKESTIRFRLLKGINGETALRRTV